MVFCFFLAAISSSKRLLCRLGRQLRGKACGAGHKGLTGPLAIIGMHGRTVYICSPGAEDRLVGGQTPVDSQTTQLVKDLVSKTKVKIPGLCMYVQICTHMNIYMIYTHTRLLMYNLNTLKTALTCCKPCVPDTGTCMIVWPCPPGTACTMMGWPVDVISWPPLTCTINGCPWT